MGNKRPSNFGSAFGPCIPKDAAPALDTVYESSFCCFISQNNITADSLFHSHSVINKK